MHRDQDHRSKAGNNSKTLMAQQSVHHQMNRNVHYHNQQRYRERQILQGKNRQLRTKLEQRHRELLWYYNIE